MVKRGLLVIALALAVGGWLAYFLLWPGAAVEDRALEPGASREFGGERLRPPRGAPWVRPETRRAEPNGTASAGSAVAPGTAEAGGFLDPDAPPPSGFAESVSDVGEFLRPADDPSPGRSDVGASDVGEYLDPEQSIGEHPGRDESVSGAIGKGGGG